LLGCVRLNLLVFFGTPQLSICCKAPFFVVFRPKRPGIVCRWPRMLLFSKFPFFCSSNETMSDPPALGCSRVHEISALPLLRVFFVTFRFAAPSLYPRRKAAGIPPPPSNVKSRGLFFLTTPAPSFWGSLTEPNRISFFPLYALPQGTLSFVSAVSKPPLSPWCCF